MTWFAGDSGFSATVFLDSAGVMNKGLLGKIFQLVKIFLFSLRLRNLFKEHGVTKVFSVGGYSASPAVFAAILFGKELYIHEQNAKTGALNRITRPFCKSFFSSFDPHSPCINYPVDARFYANRRIRTQIKQIIFMGGSLGARAINELAMASAREIVNSGIKMVHLTGERDFERVRSFYQESKLDVTISPFDKEIDKIMASSDFAVARAGASSLFELYANALPALFVPYPFAAADHQFYNASFLAEKRMAYCIREESLTKAYLLDILSQDHTAMSKKLFDTFVNDGTRCIVSHLLDKTD